MTTWHPASWRSRPIKQQPVYPDEKALDEALAAIRSYPPLIFPNEVESLRQELAEAAHGRALLLQGGDCAERFQDCTPEAITSKLKILLQMSLILSYGSRQSVVRVGRIAGQYAKPRSSEYEEYGAVKLPVFRGDNINSFERDAMGRAPDPARLVQGYQTASMTLNYIRALLANGFADIHHPENWDLSSFPHSPQKDMYQEVVVRMQDALSLVETTSGLRDGGQHNTHFYTSHEGLLLGLEEAMTRYDHDLGGYYNLGAHMLWIGDRTRDLDGAHVEYFRGIRNPVGIKWGPSADPREMVAILRTLNPDNVPGRTTIITRFGIDCVATHLPRAIQAVREAGLSVLWSADPMHGNAVLTKDGVKTRDFAAILAELKTCFRIHHQESSWLGGVHFELTGENVTECTGGAAGVREVDLKRQYETFCDPRLNYSQSLEMAFLMVDMLHSHQPAKRS